MRSYGFHHDARSRDDLRVYADVRTGRSDANKRSRIKNYGGPWIIQSQRTHDRYTALKALIPYPNEVGSMPRYIEIAQRAISKLSQKFSPIKSKIKEKAEKVIGHDAQLSSFAKTKDNGFSLNLV